MSNLRPLTTRLLLPTQHQTIVPIHTTPAPKPAPLPSLAPPAAPPRLLLPTTVHTTITPITPAKPSAASFVTPAQDALPVTPAAAAAASVLPEATPSANLPGNLVMTAITPVTTPVLPSPAATTMPTTVSAALATIAQSSPRALASQGGGSIQTYDATRYSEANTQARPPAQGNRSMSKTFTRTQRRIYCPINSGATIALSTSGTITTRPQVNFQPDQLIVSPSIAPNFDIQSWTIGIQPQQAAAGNVCGDCFPAQNGPHFQFDVCDNGTDIIFNVTNLDTAAAHVFKAMLVGYQVDIQG